MKELVTINEISCGKIFKLNDEEDQNFYMKLDRNYFSHLYHDEGISPIVRIGDGKIKFIRDLAIVDISIPVKTHLKELNETYAKEG